jgi:hypothetical protein
LRRRAGPWVPIKEMNLCLFWESYKAHKYKMHSYWLLKYCNYYLHLKDLPVTDVPYKITPLQGKREKLGEKWELNFALSISTYLKWSLACRKILHEADGFTSLRRKSCYRFLSPLKIYCSGPSFKPRTFGPMASTITITRPRTTKSVVKSSLLNEFVKSLYYTTPKVSRDGWGECFTCGNELFLPSHSIFLPL